MTYTGKKMGLTYQFEEKNFEVKSCHDLPDHKVKILIPLMERLVNL